MDTKPTYEELEQKLKELENIATERKRAEEALKKSEEKYRDLFESNKDGIVLTDMQGKILDANKAYLDMLGYEIDEIKKMTYQQLTPEKWHKREAGIVKNQFIKKGYSDEFEKEYIKKDGRVFPLSVKGWLVKDEQGQPMGMWGFVRDISERKQAEQALKEKRVELEIKANNLEEVNTALRVLLKQREGDKAELEETVLSNVKDLVLPYVERLKKTSLGNNQMSFVDILESNLKEIISPFSLKLSSKYLGLTPTEIRVANLIKGDKTTKEIAEFMNLSEKTVETHRDHIRKKIGIRHKKVNLKTYLLSM